MYVEWNPDDESEKQTWSFDPDDVLRSDAKLIEKHFGGTWDQWIQGLRTGESHSRAVLLWYMLHLIHPKLQFQDVPDFRVRQLKVEMGVLELRQQYVRAKKMRLSDEDRESFEQAFELLIHEAMEREGIDGTAEIVDGQLAIEADGIEDELPKVR